MSITRKLPDSDEKRNIALSGAKTKKDNTAPANIAITPNTITRLDAMQPLFSSLMQARANKLQAQTDSTTVKETAQARARMFVSHFIQAFNNGVDRGMFPPSHRAFYQLDVNSNSVPDISTEPLLTQWWQRLIDGDAARIAAGGAPMAMPTIAEVTFEYNAFKNANIAQSTAKNNYDSAQEDVEDQREEADKIILKVWDEVETFFNEEPITSKRNKAREWGLVYVSTVKTTIRGKGRHAVTAAALAGMSARLVETNESAVTDANGDFELVTGFVGPGNMEFAKPLFVTDTKALNIPEGGDLTQDVNLQPVG
ncbi:MAG: hypothetical protein HY841_06740 [Bacteroidetes bacterium]|nr:hypothetical protein [Bacteroidota bacterium]